MKSLRELDKITIETSEGAGRPGRWQDDLLGRASWEEREYIKRLSSKALLGYRQQREEEVFLDNI